MRLEEILEIEKDCKEHFCKINKKNVQKIYKPDRGLKKDIKIISNSDKLCDCIIECINENIIIVEILCGILTKRELEDKKKQLQNCIKIIEHLKVLNLKKVVLLYDKIDSRNLPLKKKRANHNEKINNYKLILLQNKNFNGIVC